MSEFDAYERELVVLRDRVDPLVQQLLACFEPWDAYDVVGSICGVLVDGLLWMPHGGGLYVAWAELADVFEISATPLHEAHRTLRTAATAWIHLAHAPTETGITEWIAQAGALVSAAFSLYGLSRAWPAGGSSGHE